MRQSHPEYILNSKDEGSSYLKDVTPQPDVPWAEEFGAALARWYVAEQMRKQMTRKKRRKS